MQVYFLYSQLLGQLILMAMAMTFGMTFALTLYAFTTKEDFTTCGRELILYFKDYSYSYAVFVYSSSVYL